MDSSAVPQNARAIRVKKLYDDIIDSVVEGLREDAALDGIDDNVLMELKKVNPRCRFRPPGPRLISCSMCVRFGMFSQRWYRKLEESGSFAAADPASRAVVRTLGAGQSVLAAQYAHPDSTSASSTLSTAPRAPRAPRAPTQPRLGELGAGLPRGSDLYAPVVDGEPDPRMVSQQRSRSPRACGRVLCTALQSQLRRGH